MDNLHTGRRDVPPPYRVSPSQAGVIGISTFKPGLEPPVISRYFSEEGQADTMPPAQLASYQLEALKAVVQRAYEHSPFYREKMTQAGVSPGDLEQLADLSRLPFLTKDELRGRPWLLLTCDKKDIALIQVSTGTTGSEEIYIVKRST